MDHNNDENKSLIPALKKLHVQHIKNRKDTKTYLEDELARLGAMQARVTTQLVSRSAMFCTKMKGKYHCVSVFDGDVDVVLEVVNGLSQLRNKLTLLCAHAQLYGTRDPYDSDSDAYSDSSD